MKNLKKFLKFFLIALIIVAAVAITFIIFFKNLDKHKQKEFDVLSFSSSEAKITFDTKIVDVSNSIKLDGDNRFDDIIASISRLDDAMEVVTSYYIANGTVVTNEQIAEQASLTTSLIGLANAMIEEYELKSSFVAPGGGSYYNIHLGVNDLFKTVANYTVNYAKLVLLLNENIENVDKVVDIKFAMIDLFCRVYMDDYTKTAENANKWVVANDKADAEFANLYFEIENSQLCTDAGLFSVENMQFINAYSKVNKTEFAKNLQTNCSSVTSINANSTIEQVAAFYFNEVYGI